MVGGSWPEVDSGAARHNLAGAPSVHCPACHPYSLYMALPTPGHLYTSKHPQVAQGYPSYTVSSRHLLWLFRPSQLDSSQVLPGPARSCQVLPGPARPGRQCLGRPGQAAPTPPYDVIPARREARLCGESHRGTGARAYRWYLPPINSYPQTSCWTTKFVVICRTEETCDQDLWGHYKSSNK